MFFDFHTWQYAAFELHGLASIREAGIVTDLEEAAVKAKLAFALGDLVI